VRWQLGLQSPSFGQPCSVMPCSHSPFGGNTSGLRLPSHAGTLSIHSPCSSTSVCSPSPVDGVLVSCLPFHGSTSGSSLYTCLHSPGNISTSHSAMPCAQGTNASCLVVVAFSASLVGSMPAVPLARASAAPTTSSTPPHSSVSTPKGSTFLASVSATVHVSPTLSRSPGPPLWRWSIDESSNADAPPDFSRSSVSKSGGFKGSGQRASVACCSVAIPSPGGLSQTRVSGGDRMGVRVKTMMRNNPAARHLWPSILQGMSHHIHS